MRILIDIGHPGHVHLFRPFAKEMIGRGHHILFTCREKEFEKQLLEAAGFDYMSFGKKFKGTIGKMIGLLKFDLLEFLQGLKFKPDLLMSHGSPYAAHAAFLLRKPHVSLEDTGNMEQMRLYLPFTKTLLTSTAFHKEFGDRQIRYHGYHELAYLHPQQFSPDPKIYERLQINRHREFVILRFISWSASHDVNQSGLSLHEKREIVSLLEKQYRVFISAEGELPEEFKKYKITIPPEEMHHALAFAKMFIGEGATMASECAMLGTPAIYINSLSAGTIDEQVSAGLIFHFRSTRGLTDKIKDLMHTKELKAQFLEKRNAMLLNKINVTAFLVWFIDTYPGSIQVMKQDPSFQYNFR